MECDHCGAKVPARTSHGTYTCEYCGHRVRVDPPAPERPPAQPAPQVRIEVTHATPSKHKGSIGWLVGLILTISFGFPVFSQLAKMGITSLIGSGGLVGERIFWDTVGGPPVPVMVAGKEHVLGRIREMDEGELTIRLYDSATLEERWRSPDLGTYGQSYRAVHHAVLGDRLVASDGRNVLHVYDLAEGKELGTHPLTDRANELCALAGGSKVWVEVVDERHLLFDVQSFVAEEAPERPSECAGLRYHGLPPGSRAPEVSGLEPKRLFVEGESGVVYGTKKPGTPVVLASGFDPKNLEVRWTKPPLQVDLTAYRSSFEKFYSGLANGRFVALYGAGTDAWHVGALDARTGDPLWDVTLRNIFAADTINGFELTPSFVYIVRTNSLDVLSAKDGELVGAIGFTTYED